jgi:hypothetical protein
MAAKSRIARMIYDIRIPVLGAMGLIALSIANYKLGWNVRLSDALSLSYLALRVFLAASAGYLATHRTSMGVWGAAIAGGLVFLAEQMVAGIWFILNRDLVDALRVAQSFLLLFWVSMLIGAAGGFVGRSWRKSEQAAI